MEANTIPLICFLPEIVVFFFTSAQELHTIFNCTSDRKLFLSPLIYFGLITDIFFFTSAAYIQVHLRLYFIMEANTIPLPVNYSLFIYVSCIYSSAHQPMVYHGSKHYPAKICFWPENCRLLLCVCSATAYIQVHFRLEVILIPANTFLPNKLTSVLFTSAAYTSALQMEANTIPLICF